MDKKGIASRTVLDVAIGLKNLSAIRQLVELGIYTEDYVEQINGVINGIVDDIRCIDKIINKEYIENMLSNYEEGCSEP